MDDLRHNFDAEASDSIKSPSNYARNFLEYCCFRALALSTQIAGHLADKDFRRLTFDMMLAWEAPAAADQPLLKVVNLRICSKFCFGELLRQMLVFCFYCL